MTGWISRAGIVVVGLAGLLAGATAPPRPEPVVDPLTIPGDPPYVACPVALAGSGFDSTVGVVTDSSITGIVSGVGVRSGSAGFSIDGDETFRFEVGRVAELGVTPLLVERTEGGAIGAAVLGRAGTSTALAGCAAGSSSPVALLGLATNDGERAEIVLTNPFAVEATGRLTGWSEFGLDTVAEVETVRVPADSTLTLPLSQVMAGRQQLGFTLYTDAGSLVAGMTRSGLDSASSEAISGSQQWFAGLPGFGLEGQLVVRNLSPNEASYRVDAVGPEGIVEGVDTGSLARDTERWLSLTDLGASGGYIVSADETVAVATVYAGEFSRVVSTASPSQTVAWLVPISSEGPGAETAVWIFNPGETSASAEISVFGGTTSRIELAAGTTTGQIVGFGGRGGMVTATGPVAVFYGVLTEGGAASMTLAYPLE